MEVPYEVFRLADIDDSLRVDMANQMDNVIGLIRRDDAHDIGHRRATVAAVGIEARGAMMKLAVVRGKHLLRARGHDLERHAFVATVERVDGLGGQKLEDDRIRRMLPAEDRAEDAQDDAVKHEHILPDGTASLVGDHEGNEVGSSSRGAAFQCDGDGQPVEYAAEQHAQDGVVEQRLEGAELQKGAGEKHLQHREDDEAPTDAAPHEHRYGNVQGNHAKRGGEAHAKQLCDAIDKNRKAGEAAR